MNLRNRLIIVVGLGYVGLPLAVEFGKKRHVVGFDTNTKRILELQDGYDQTLEISNDELVAAKYLEFTSDIVSYYTTRSIEEVVFIVTVPTPVDEANRPDLTPLIKASETVGGLLKANDVVIYESTVYPGATEEICVPILQNLSGLKFLSENPNTNESASAIDQLNGFYVGYSPERINPGDKSHRLTNIMKITSGSTSLVLMR
jgi:UDP-N-acetyl-D-galactosamine dehydrogenase